MLPDSSLGGGYGEDLTRGPNGTVNGEGGPAVNAFLIDLVYPVVASDGTVYVASNDGWTGQRILRITPDGILTRVAGSWATTLEAPREGLHIHSVASGGYRAMAIDASNNLYIVFGADANRVYRVGADSLLHVVAGNGGAGQSAEGVQATTTPLSAISAIAVGPDGSLYIMENDAWSWARGYKVTPDGVIRTFIGGGNKWPWETTDPLQVAFYAYSEGPGSIAVTPDNDVMIGMGGNAPGVVVQVAPNGTMRMYAGSATAWGPSGDKGPSLAAHMGLPSGLAPAPDGSLLIADYYSGWVWRVAAPMPGFSGGAFVVASEDGSELYNFDAGGRHLRTVNIATGKPLYEFSYDAAGRIIAVKDGIGRSTTIERGMDGSAHAIIAPSGVRTTIGTDSESNLTSALGPDGQMITFEYVDGGLLVARNDAGAATAASFDAQGRISSITNANGGMTSLVSATAPDGSSLEAAIPTGEGASVVYRRLPSGAQTTTTLLTGGGKITTTTSPNGDETVSYADGTTVTTQLSGDSRLGMQAPTRSVISRLPSGLTKFESFRRGVEGEDPSDIFNVFSQTDSFTVNGRARTLTFDRSTNSVVGKSAEGRTVSLELDGLGRVTDVDVPGRPHIASSFDLSGRITNLSIGSKTLSYEYDGTDRLTSFTDPNGWTTKLDYDANGRLKHQTLAGGRTISYDYDAIGRLAQLTPPGGLPYRWKTDTAGNLTEFNMPGNIGAASMAFAYDSAGRVRTLWRNGHVVMQMQYAPNTPNVTIASVSGDTIDKQYDPITRLPSSLLRRHGSSLSYSYDGALVKAIQWSGATAGIVRFGYDPDFRLASEQVGSGPLLTYQYDGDSRVVGVGDLQVQRSELNGSIIGTTLASVTTARAYSSDGDPDSLAASFAGTRLYSAKFSVDAGGRITQKVETVRGSQTVFGFAYDSTGALASVQRNGVLVEQYDYDLAGNRTRVTSPAGVTAGEYDEQGKLISYGTATFAYGDAGELTRRVNGTDTTSFHFDGWQKLQSVTLSNGSQISYVLDSKGRRVGRSVDGVVTNRWLYDDDLRIAAEVDESGNALTRFVYATRTNVPDYMVRQGTTYRLVIDERGSVRLVVNATTGELLQEIDYDGYGRVTRNTNPGFQPFGYAGGLTDDATHLVHFGAREYDPELGRWLSSDPASLAAGDHNLYRYASDDPINRIDPSGRWSLAETWAAMTVEQQVLTVVTAATTATLAVLQSQGNGWEGTYVPIASTTGTPSSSERCQNNEQGDEHGCMNCGSPVSGLESGNWVFNHIPATSMNNPGDPQCGGPHCGNCSNEQGGYLSQLLKWLKESPRSREEFLDYMMDLASRWQ